MELNYIFPEDPVKLVLEELNMQWARRDLIVRVLCKGYHYEKDDACELLYSGVKSGRLIVSNLTYPCKYALAPTETVYEKVPSGVISFQ